MARLRLMELYDDTYGIVDHDADLSPFSLASQVEQEDSLLVSGFGGYLDEYLDNKIEEYLGINFATWMTYTYAKQKLMITRVKEYASKNNDSSNANISKLEKALADAQKQIKGG